MLIQVLFGKAINQFAINEINEITTSVRIIHIELLGFWFDCFWFGHKWRKYLMLLHKSFSYYTAACILEHGLYEHIM